jgi:hypothetical protein
MSAQDKEIVKPTELAKDQIPQKVAVTTAEDSSTQMTSLISQLTSALKLTQPSKPNPTPDNKTTAFEEAKQRMNYKSQQGKQFVIDVQPDTRMSIPYIIHSIASLAPTINVIPHSLVSVFTLYAYDQIILYAYLLQMDLNHRIQSSPFAAVFNTSNHLMEYNETLKQLIVPEDMAYILQGLTPIHEPHKQNVNFVPTLAGYVHSIDYGRTIPPYIWIVIHNLFAEIPDDENTIDLIRRFYSTTVTQVNRREYLVSHYLAGYFTHQDIAQQRPNWLNARYENEINKYFGHMNRHHPTLQLIELELTASETCNINPYRLALSATRNNIPAMTELLKEISEYLKTNNLGKKTIADITHSTESAATLTHTIEPATLPTWHYAAAVPNAIENAPHTVQFNEYATTMRYMRPASAYAMNLPYPDLNLANFVPELYLVQDHRHDNAANDNPYTYMEFDEQKHVAPNVLLYQPYNRLPNYAQLSIILGIKIEQPSIDGVTLPLVNPDYAPIRNNSIYLAGSIPYAKIKRIIPCRTQNGIIRIIPRVTRNIQESPQAIHHRTAQKVIVPIYDSSNVAHNLHPPIGYSVEQHHFELAHPYTYTSWNAGQTSHIRNDTIALWSSYRHTINNNCDAHDIHFYYTLIGFYGQSTPLSEIRNPVTNFPPI